MSSPVFVLGTGRCGSTLVHEVLARHPETGFMTNLDDLGVLPSTAWQNTLWRRLPPAVTRKGGTRFAPTEGYRALGREVGPQVVDPVRDLTAADATPWLRTRIRRFFDVRAERLGTPVFLHKLTGWPRAGLLHECYPDAVFIEVVRDGRAVASSWLQMDWWRGHLGPGGWHFGPLPPELEQHWLEADRSFAVLAAIGWRLLLDAYDEARAAVPPEQWVRVRYEDVLADPDGGFARMLAGMGLDRSPEFVSGLSRYEFTDRRAEAFRKDLSSRDIAAMEVVLGKQLAALGYG